MHGVTSQSTSVTVPQLTACVSLTSSTMLTRAKPPLGKSPVTGPGTHSATSAWMTPRMPLAMYAVVPSGDKSASLSSVTLAVMYSVMFAIQGLSVGTENRSFPGGVIHRDAQQRDALGDALGDDIRPLSPATPALRGARTHEGL